MNKNINDGLKIIFGSGIMYFATYMFSLLNDNLAPDNVAYSSSSESNSLNASSLMNSISSSTDIIFTIIHVLCFISFAIGLISIFYACNESKVIETNVLQEPQEKKEDENKKNEISPSIDFENKELNKKTEDILYKIEQLKNSALIKNDPENSILLDSIKTTYLKKLVDNYKSVPQDLRDKKNSEGKSSYDMTLEQLNIIENKVSKIEKDMIDYQHKDLRVFNNFLEDKMYVEKEFEQIVNKSYIPLHVEVRDFNK